MIVDLRLLFEKAPENKKSTPSPQKYILFHQENLLYSKTPIFSLSENRRLLFRGDRNQKQF